MKHTVVLSDLHLWEAVAGEGLWMRYRQRRYFPDAALVALFERLDRECEPGSIELVLNGDVFDFDIARPDGQEDPPRDERSAVARMHSILDDHEPFLDGLARLLSRGHAVVFIAGNHDLPLVLTNVQRALRSRIEAALERADASAATVSEAMERVSIKGWFHRTREGVHVEHGQQYDAYTSVPHPLWPVATRRAEMQQTLGSLTMRYLIGRLGYFNPNVDESFLLSLGGYLAHWVRYYLFTPRSLALRWLFGTLQVAVRLLRDTEKKSAAREAVSLVRASHESGASMPQLIEHAYLEQPAALRRAARLLCLDRMVQLVVLCIALAMFTVDRTAGWVSLAFTAVLALVFRFVLPDGELAENYRHVRLAQRSIARIYGARAVVFGHTHIPEGQWEHGVFVGNCGSWAPMFLDIACTHAVQSAQPFVWLRSENGAIEGGLYRFDGRAITAASGERCESAPRGQWAAA